MLKMADISKMDGKMINSKILELRKELFELKMHQAVAAMEKPHRKSEIKNDIARLMSAKNVKGDK